MKNLSTHHQHIIHHVGLAILGLTGSIMGFMINSIDTFASGPVTNYSEVFVGSFAGLENYQTDLHWQFGGNDFEGLMFLRSHKTLTTPQTVSINATTKSCAKQVRGLYYNSARGQILWPLDQDSLTDLQNMNSSYDDLQIQGGLYIGCDGNTNNIFGQVTHIFNTLEHKIVAGVDINTTTNSYTHAFANTLGINNTIVGDYIVDSVGGVASADGIGPAYGSNNTTGATTTESGAVFTSTGAVIVGTGNSGDIVQIVVGGEIYTGVVGSGGVFEIPVVLAIGDNEIVITITDPETEESTQTTITVAVVTTPPVTDFCPNGDYSGDAYDEDCGQAPAPSTGNNKGSNPVKMITDEDLGICEPGEDNSESYYDRVCTDDTHNSAEEKPSLPIDNTFDFIKEVGAVMKSMTCNLSQEIVEAYVFARSINMTTVNNICNANMMGPLRRKEMAKFSSMFALKVLDSEPDTTRVCVFNDVANQSAEMQAFMQLSCQLGNMGLKRSGIVDENFRPDDIVTVGELATLVSRMIYGSIHNTPENDPRPRYQEHTKALYKDGIMKKIDSPGDPQLRGYALIVFQRVYNMINK